MMTLDKARQHVGIVICSSHLPGWKENRESWAVISAHIAQGELVGAQTRYVGPNKTVNLEWRFCTLDHAQAVKNARCEVTEIRFIYTAPPSPIDRARIEAVISNLGEHMEGYGHDPALVAYVNEQLDTLQSALGETNPCDHAWFTAGFGPTTCSKCGRSSS